METIWCEIEERKVKIGKCLYNKNGTQLGNQTCPKCDYFKSLFSTDSTEKTSESHQRKILQKLINRPKSIYWHKNRSKQNPKEITITSDPRHIKRFHSFLENLHETFWRSPKFMMWQLIRLHEQYRKDIDTLSDIYLSFLNDINAYDWVKSIFYKLGRDYFPDSGESFDHWEVRYKGEVFSIEYDLLRLQKEFEHKSFLLQTEIKDLSLMTIKNEGNRFLLSPLAIYAATVFPIDYCVHFPLPYFLDRLPPLKTRFKQWKKNLLAFELIQNEWKNKPIIDLLFEKGAEGSYRRIPIIKKETSNHVLLAYGEFKRLTT